jgi:16S rRNA (cytidine1402-2'-O)-methyltransferase
MTALAVAGFGPIAGFQFMGFPPARSKERKAWFERAGQSSSALVLFESPHRIRETLRELEVIIGKRPILVGRELTKAHEDLVRGPISEVLDALHEPRGEYTIVIAPQTSEGSRQKPELAPPQPRDVAREFGLLTNNRGLTRRQAIAELSKRYRLSARAVFSALEQAKKLVD